MQCNAQFPDRVRSTYYILLTYKLESKKDSEETNFNYEIFHCFAVRSSQ